MNASEKTAPFDVSHNAKQDLRPIRSMTKCNFKIAEYSCALARPAGGAFGRA